MVRNYLKIVRRINSFFISIILFLVYFPIVGLCFCIYKVTTTDKNNDQASTYWKSPPSEKCDKKYFQSAY